LKLISNGIHKSERHNIYLYGSQKEKDNLKYKSGYGPIGSDTEVYISSSTFEFGEFFLLILLAKVSTI